MRITLAALSLLMPTIALADIPLLTSTSTPGGESYSTSLTALLLVTALGAAPFVILVMTPFLRISIVLGLMRTALGTNSAPSNKIISAIALILTAFIMQPQITAINDVALKPYQEGAIKEEAAISNAWGVMRDFMVSNTRESSLDSVISISNMDTSGKTLEELPFSVITCAFMISELTTAFYIAFMCFIPFLIIDLLTGVLLMSLGMMMVSPMIISLPLKIGFFVVMDGWSLLVMNLARSFN